MSALLSVGIDLGTTTTQLVFSRLTIRNEGNAATVPRFAITDKEILYRSGIHFTPLRSETEIDVQRLRALVAAEYAAAGVQPAQLQTGAVIITGETARKENARAVLEALSGFAGNFVVATAGPALESVLAGKGAGAQARSAAQQCAVLNLDIGGGTTNMALFDCGALRATGCLDVGGHLMKLTPEGEITYIAPVLRDYVNLKCGQRVTPQQLAPVTALLVRVLEWAVLGLGAPGYPDFVADQPIAVQGRPLLSFSGGVADLMDGQSRPPFAYGDLGVLLGQALLQSRLCAPGGWCRAAETIRATVIGAGSHTTELSGSTIFHEGVRFPMKNLPVVCLSAQEQTQEVETLAEILRQRFALLAPQEPAVLALEGWPNPRFAALSRLADALAHAMRGRCGTGLPLLVAVQADMGKALGQALRLRLPEAGLLCLDGIALPEGAYLDIGMPIAGGQALPVVVKTLVV